MKVLPWFALCIVSLCAAQFIIYQNYKIEHLNDFARFSEKARQIDQDQIRDLMYSLQNARIEKEAANTAGFVAGVIDATNRKDVYSEIWHSGYSRGSENQILMDESKKDIIQSVKKED